MWSFYMRKWIYVFLGTCLHLNIVSDPYALSFTYVCHCHTAWSQLFGLIVWRQLRLLFLDCCLVDILDIILQ